MLYVKNPLGITGSHPSAIGLCPQSGQWPTLNINTISRISISMNGCCGVTTLFLVSQHVTTEPSYRLALAMIVSTSWQSDVQGPQCVQNEAIWWRDSFSIIIAKAHLNMFSMQPLCKDGLIFYHCKGICPSKLIMNTLESRLSKHGSPKWQSLYCRAVTDMLWTDCTET